MAEEIEKMNIRNPFFITATGEGAPDLPDAVEDPVDDPDVPAIYVQPETLTQNVVCGQEINIGEDVGGRIYNFDVGEATGNVTIDYIVNVPISIVGTWNATTPSFSTTGYVGNDLYEQDLLDAGISSGNMSLGTGVQTGTVTISKTAATPTTVSVLVSAPLRTDDYKLTFNCPSAPAVTDPGVNIPSTIPSHTSFVEQIPAFYVYKHPQSNFNLQLKVNDVVWGNITDSRWIVFTDYDGVADSFGIHRSRPSSASYVTGNNGCISEWTTPTTFIAQSSYFNTDLNKIEFIYTHPNGQFPSNFWNFSPTVRYVKSGLFYDNVNSQFRYPIHSNADQGGFSWFAKYQQGNQQNDNTTFIGKEIKFPTTVSTYSSDPFSNYGYPNKYTIQFHYRLSSPSGLDNPTRSTNAYYDIFKGQTYRQLLDDGAAIQESAIIGDDGKLDGSIVWCGT